MMNLKEAFRYQNFLDELLGTAYSYLNNKNFVVSTVETHLKSQVNPDAKDEVIEVQKPYDVEFTPNDLIDFVVKVINEKEKISNIISDAKMRTEIDIDVAIALNKKKQGLARVLQSLSNIKSGEKVRNASDYKFNIDGNQVSYYYKINEVTQIDFNRNDVRGLYKKLLKETDEVSTKLDSILINTELDFNPSWDINDSFEECVVA